MLFEQAAAIENLPATERVIAEPHLRDIKVVLIRTLISDQLAYVNIAKDWFTIQDLREIQQHKIGSGKIGGKSAGMLLARRILENVASTELNAHLTIPESYFLGADVTYAFMAMNNLMHWNDQKYKSEANIRSEYQQIVSDFLVGIFPQETMSELRTLLGKVGNQPLIVRSSSLLEDNFGTSFAGKYESLFCPNQGTLEENLYQLTQAIQRIYARILNPNALLTSAKGLHKQADGDPVQVVQGGGWMVISCPLVPEWHSAEISTAGIRKSAGRMDLSAWFGDWVHAQWSGWEMITLEWWLLVIHCCILKPHPV
jgi:hypothetical protein